MNRSDGVPGLQVDAGGEEASVKWDPILWALAVPHFVGADRFFELVYEVLKNLELGFGFGVGSDAHCLLLQ